MKTLFSFSFVLLLAAAAWGREEEIIDSVTIGQTNYQHVRVVEATPVDLLFAYDGGYKRLKLQDLPEPLKSNYPYDKTKAAEYIKKKSAEPQELAAQGRAATHADLVVREQSLQNRIAPLQTELKRLNDQIKTQHRAAKGKGKKSQQRQETDELRQNKIALEKQLWKLQDEQQLVKEHREKLE